MDRRQQNFKKEKKLESSHKTMEEIIHLTFYLSVPIVVRIVHNYNPSDQSKMAT